MQHRLEKICVVGSLSCDLVMRVPRRPQKGETIIGSEFATFVGGKGNNQALAAARAGGIVSMIGRVGRDHFGDTIEHKLKTTSVDCRYLSRDEELSTGIADILVDADGDNSICIAPQANSRLSAENIEAAREVIAESKFLLMQLEIPIETVLAAARLGRKESSIVILNPAPAPIGGALPEELWSLLDLIVPNQTEAELLTGIPVVDLMSAIDAARALQSKGVGKVIITMGEMGALLLEEGKIPSVCPAFEVPVVDTTAAGDAFCGALVAALSRGATMDEAMVAGCAAGALATTTLGAEPSLPTRTEIEKLIASRAGCAAGCGSETLA